MQSDRITRHANTTGVSYTYYDKFENVHVKYILYTKKAANGVEKFCAKSVITPVDQTRAYWSERINDRSPIIASVMEDFILNLKSSKYPNIGRIPDDVRKDVAAVMMTIVDKVCGGHSVDGPIC